MSNEVKVMYDDRSIDVSKEVSLVWSIANSLRGPYKSDKYKDVIIPMIILRRLECALDKTKQAVVDAYEKNPNTPKDILEVKSGYSFYNTSPYTLKKLLNDPNKIAENLKEYINNFSANIQNIFGKEEGLDFFPQIDKMDKNNRLYSVVKKFSELDLNPETVDGMKMGYMFEDIIRRFSENAEAGDHYTPREVIRLMANILLAEGCDDLLTQGKVCTVLDMACGTGGMLSTTYDFLKRLNPKIDVRLFGQEVNPESFGICLADMLIKGQKIDTIVFQDTMKKDRFEGQPMRLVIANPPFGQPWGGKDAAEGVEKSVRDEHEAKTGRFDAGLPATGDMQLLFMQHAIYKMDENLGRAAIISNGSPLFSGSTTSGESQIRRMMLEKDLVEAIIALPTDLFYNTNIGIYIWILSKNKREERKGKVQLINAASDKFYKKLRKSLGKKRNELSREHIKKITQIYADFENGPFCKILPNEEFLYKEYTVYQPMQRSYGITEERIENLVNNNVLSNFFDADKFEELSLMEPRPAKEEKEFVKFTENKPIFENIIATLKTKTTNKKFNNKDEFIPFLTDVLDGVLVNVDKPKDLIEKIAHGLSVIDKEAEIQKDKKGNIIYDPETKDSEIVKLNKDVDEYFEEEVYPHIPDAHYVYEYNPNKKGDKEKLGAEIPFTRYFYEYQEPEKSEDLLKKFFELENDISFKLKDF